MKKLLLLSMITAFVSFNACAQDKKPASPPAKVTETISSGATLSINYSQPSVKGRKIGSDIAPYGEVWRTGANAATVFETSKAITVNGKALPAGKYSLYSIPTAGEWTFIFNKTWDQWGTKYSEADDALRVMVKPGKTKSFTEQMTFAIAKSGTVSLMWGDVQADLMVK